MSISSVENNTNAVFPYVRENRVNKANSFITRNAKAIVITAVVLAVLVNFPSAEAMSSAGYEVCKNACKAKYRGDQLSWCLEECWKAYSGRNGNGL